MSATLPTPAQMVLSGSSTPPRQFPRVEQTTTVEKEVFGPNDGSTLRTVVEDPEYDTTYGYVTDATRTVTQPGVSGSWVSETDYDRGIIDGADQWCLGLPGTVETSQSLPGGSPQVRRVAYEFNSDCRLDTVTDLSDTLDTTKQLETSYGYDQYGNVNAVSEYSVAAPSAARTTTIGYDGAGQLPTSVTIDSAGLNLTTTLSWDYLLGLRSSVTGPDSLTTSFEYDAFGRLTKETRPAGSTDITYLECSSCLPQHAAYFAHAEDSAGGDQYTFFDHLGRAVGSDTALRGGARSREECGISRPARPRRRRSPTSRARACSGSATTTTASAGWIEEDAPVSETQGSGAVTSYEYLGHTLKVTDPENHATQYIHNALGQIEQVIDALGGDTLYSYHPFGELHQVTDDASNQTTILYDLRGFKSDLYDPDMGHWAYEHNAFGELIWQEDAKGQEVDLYYDKAGRLDSRVEAEGTTNWSYYTSGTGRKGRLEEVTGPGGLEEAYVYSSTHGALTQVTRTIGATSYTFDYAFDSHGRLIEMTYPENVHQARFGVEYAYDGWGALEHVYNAATPSLVYYTADSQDALGRMRQATLGNGLVEKLGYSRATGRLVSIETGPAQTATLQDLAYDWDLAGKLIERFDDNLNQTDVFTYDALNRLEEVERDSSTILTLTYNALGNIVTKSDLTGTYAYGAGSAGPHAVTSIGTMTFGYDLNGNMMSRNGATIGWTSYNLPNHITHTNGDYADFTYGPDRSRWIQEAEEGTWEYTRHYAGTGFEVLTWGTNSRVDTHYIFAGGQAVAQFTTSNVESDLLQYRLASASPRAARPNTTPCPDSYHVGRDCELTAGATPT